ncbi:hypothetical protein [Mesorhizobium caraganae]|uniref:hypothetical protein n=1 Tax=Mesorhizobium caraganae TaxID=483206 RepID=UPI0028A231B5|nr:hypothetical protein [Mesorhizobium caraganae]
MILGVAQATVRFHVDNARRKAGRRQPHPSGGEAGEPAAHIGRDQPERRNKKGRLSGGLLLIISNIYSEDVICSSLAPSSA